MKVLLITPPSSYLVRDMAGGLGFGSGPENILPPLDLLWLATVLEKENHQVKILDCQAQKLNLSTVEKKIKEFLPTHFIISVSLPTLKTDCQFIKFFKKKYPKKFFVAKFNLENQNLLKEVLLRSQANICLFADNELLIEKILKGKEKAGTAFLEKNKILKYPAKVLEDLNQLPIPNRLLLNNKLYHYSLLGNQPTATVQTSRGCPMTCAFYCPYPLVQGKKWLSRSPSHIFKELKEIVNKYQIQNILFRDAIFTLDQKRIANLCQLIIENKLKFHWWCETRINFLNCSLLKKMKKAGLKGINIGVETGDPVLMAKEAKPGISINDLFKLKSWTDRLKIKLHFLLMIGLPNESKKSLKKTYLLLKKLKPDSMGLTLATPYPGTPFWQEIKRKKWLTSKNWRKYDGHHCIIRTKYLSNDELTFAYKQLNELFYLLKHQNLKNKLKLFFKEKIFNYWLNH